MTPEGIFSGRAPRATNPIVDIVLICYQPNKEQVRWSIDGVLECTNAPYNLLVVLDGFAPEDAQPIRDYLTEQAEKFPAMLSHRAWYSPQPHYFGASLVNALAALSGCEMVVVMQPHIRLRDPDWFGKVQQPILQDCALGAVLFGEPDPSVSSVPWRVPMPEDVPHRPLMAFSRQMAEALRATIDRTRIEDLRWQKQVVTEVYRCNAFAWVVPTVRVDTMPGRTVHAPVLSDGPRKQKAWPTVAARASGDS